MIAALTHRVWSLVSRRGERGAISFWWMKTDVFLLGGAGKRDVRGDESFDREPRLEEEVLLEERTSLQPDLE